LAKRVVGQTGKRRDAVTAPPVLNWQTDVITNREEGWSYQFFREDEVRSKLHPTRVQIVDFETGDLTVHDIPAWTIVQRDTGPEVAAGFRPDEGKPVDTALTHGGGGTIHWCMKIPTDKWEILQQAQEQRADAYEAKLAVKKHYAEAWGEDERQTNPYTDREVRPGEIRRFEQFTRG
jgi:hypothetical protein